MPASPPQAPKQEGEGKALGGLVRHSSIYGLIPIIKNGVSVLMNRFFTGWFFTSQFAAKELIDLVFIALQQLLGFNVLGAMMRFYFEQKNERDRAAVISTTTLVLGAISWIVCGLCFAFRAELAPLFLGEGDENVSSAELTQLLGLALFTIPFQLTTQAGFTYVQTLKRSALYTKLTTLKFFFEVGLQFTLIGIFGMGVRGFLLSLLIGEVVSTLTLTSWTLWTVRPRIDLRVFKPVLFYTLPLIPVGFCQLALHQLDRRLLEEFDPTGLKAVGIYALGYKIGFMVNAMVLHPFVQIWQPWIYEVKERAERSALVARVTTYALVAIASAGLVFILFAKQGVFILAGRPEYRPAFEAVPWITAGYILWSIYLLGTQITLFIEKRTGQLVLINLAAVAANVALNYWLVPILSFRGSALATMGTFGLLAMMGMVVSYRVTEIRFELGRLGAILLGTALACGAAYYVDLVLAPEETWSVPMLALKAAALLAILAFFWWGILTPVERVEFRSWALKRFRR